MPTDPENLYLLLAAKMQARTQAHTVAENELRTMIGELCGEVLALKRQLADIRMLVTNQGATLQAQQHEIRTVRAKIAVRRAKGR